MQANEPVSNPNQQTSSPQPTDTPNLQQQPSDISSPVQESTQREKSNKWLTIGLGAFALVALGIAGFFAYQNYQLKKQVEKPSPGPEITPTKELQPTPTNIISVPSPTPTADPTGEWKTYTNEEYGFQIKHPNELTPKEVRSYGTQKLDHIGFLNENDKDKQLANFSIYKNWVGGWIAKDIRKEEIVVDEAVGKMAIWLSCQPYEEPEECGQKISLENYKSGFISIDFERNNDRWLVKGWVWNKGESDESKQMENVKQVLSTFRFL